MGREGGAVLLVGGRGGERLWRAVDQCPGPGMGDPRAGGSLSQSRKSWGARSGHNTPSRVRRHGSSPPSRVQRPGRTPPSRVQGPCIAPPSRVEVGSQEVSWGAHPYSTKAGTRQASAPSLPCPAGMLDIGPTLLEEEQPEVPQRSGVTEDAAPAMLPGQGDIALPQHLDEAGTAEHCRALAAAGRVGLPLDTTSAGLPVLLQVPGDCQEGFPAGGTGGQGQAGMQHRPAWRQRCLAAAAATESWLLGDHQGAQELAAVGGLALADLPYFQHLQLPPEVQGDKLSLGDRAGGEEGEAELARHLPHLGHGAGGAGVGGQPATEVMYSKTALCPAAIHSSPTNGPPVGGVDDQAISQPVHLHHLSFLLPPQPLPQLLPSHHLACPLPHEGVRGQGDGGHQPPVLSLLHLHQGRLASLHL